MKHVLTTISLATLFGLSSSAVSAANHYRHNHYQDTARVTHVEPLYKTARVSSPQRECWQEPTYRQSHREDYNSYTPTIAGAIVGGVFGNQFGGGSGKTALTVAGTLLGASMSRDYVHHPSKYRSNYGGQCRVTNRYYEETRIDGYRVTYKYNGKTYTTRMDQDPGHRIPVKVSVRPAGRDY